MPCVNITVTAPSGPDIRASRTGVNTSNNQVAINWQATNQGDTAGSGSFDVKAGSKIQTVNVTLDPGQTDSGQVVFDFNFDSDTEIQACVGTACTSVTVPTSGDDGPPENGGGGLPTEALAFGVIAGVGLLAAAAREQNRN